MHWHPETVICRHGDLSALREAASKTSLSPAIHKNAEKVLSLWTSANSLKQLHRFADARQPSLLEPPLPDGSNIGGDAAQGDYKDSLRHEWMFRRALVRHFHLPGLFSTGEKPAEAVVSFSRLYGIGRCLLELELERCPSQETVGGEDDYLLSTLDPDADLVSWIKSSREIIEDTLNEVAETAYEEHQTTRSRFFPNNNMTSQTPLSREERLQRSLSPDLMHIMLDKMIKASYSG
jgi:hypothetical protein